MIIFYTPYIPRDILAEQQLIKFLDEFKEKYPNVWGNCQIVSRTAINWGGIHQLMLEEFPDLCTEIICAAELGIKCIANPTGEMVRLHKIKWKL